MIPRMGGGRGIPLLSADKRATQPKPQRHPEIYFGSVSTALRVKTVNLKSDMPSVQEALQRLEREMAVARQGKLVVLKVIHGYGSSGAGGDIRIAVQRRLHELAEGRQIRGCIFGENWSKSDESTWRLLQAEFGLKSDPDLGRRNLGITIVLL